MGKTTNIDWCDSTVNATTGCGGCELWKVSVGGPCYAGNHHETRLAKSLPNLYDREFHRIRLAPGRMAKAAAMPDLSGKRRPDKPWLDGLPRLIFVGDMGDLFSAGVPFDYIESEVIGAALSPKGRRHVWMLLTKRPSRLAEFASRVGGPWPGNVWAGVSVTTQETVRRAEILAGVPLPLRYLSVEPLLGPIRFPEGLLSSYSLVIVGGESGPDARPCDIENIRAVVRQCKAAGAACFVKQMGSRPYDSTCRISIDGPDSHAVEINLRDPKGGDIDEFPEDLRVREFPAARGAA